MQNKLRTQIARKRRQDLLALLSHQPVTLQKIFDTLYLDPNADVKKQFYSDLAILRKQGCTIDIDKSTNCYRWQNPSLRVTLPQQYQKALAILVNTFQKSKIPYASEIRSLLEYLQQHLQDEAHLQDETQLQIQLHEGTNYENLDPFILQKIEYSLRHKQQLSFTYCTPRDGIERSHVVEPENLTFKEGHLYLIGWSTDGKELTFRVDYILPATISVLPKKVAPQHPPQRTYTLEYILSPTIARHSISQHFPNQTSEQASDGIHVKAEISDLFSARRIILGYGENCILKSPPQLKDLMTPVAKHYAQHYLKPLSLPKLGSDSQIE